ncbi:DNA-directed RNA polymerase subunit H [Candidatus Woesearchaeota archaeon]|nr:DNA-directed RNA polymerase subunit H [Candidatus Woesearchaeota archaeon]
MAIDITKHFLVPEHTKMTDSEVQKLYQKYNLSSKELPKIKKEDPAIAKLQVKVGDVIKVERKSATAGKSYYYRVVIDG